MRWMWVTATLLGASVCLLAWIYLRDRDPASSPPPVRHGVRVHVAPGAERVRTAPKVGGSASGGERT